jgi:hypothetical protein
VAAAALPVKKSGCHAFHTHAALPGLIRPFLWRLSVPARTHVWLPAAAQMRLLIPCLYSALWHACMHASMHLPLPCLQAGDLLVTISKDCTARLWNVVTRQPITVLRGHKGSLNCMWLHPIGSLLLTGSEDGTARVWNVRKAATTMILSHKQPVMALAVSKDTKHAMTSCHSKAAWLWNLDTGECTKMLRVGPSSNASTYSCCDCCSSIVVFAQ